MCLSVIYKGKQKAKALAKLPDVMTGWAAIVKTGNQYRPYYRSVPPPFHAGQNKAVQHWVYSEQTSRYRAGFHRFLSRKDLIERMAGQLRHHQVYPMSCIIRKKDITTIGEQEGSLCIVAKEITCPARFWVFAPENVPYCGKKGD